MATLQGPPGKAGGPFTFSCGFAGRLPRTARRLAALLCALGGPGTAGCGERGGGAPIASPTHGGAWESRAPEPAPAERPGLGTAFGEARDSPAIEVDFVRATARPFAVARVFYDDRAGVEARAAYAGGPRFSDVPAARGAITFSLRDEDGEPLEAVRAGGRLYVVGEEGRRYSIVIANHTSARFEAVATVDGRDVISGRSGSFDNEGYVVAAWSTLEIDGFRRNLDEVAAFRFSPVSDSYAAARDDDRDVGVIGIAFFSERGDAFPLDELRRRDTARPFPGESRFAQPPP